MKLRTRMCRETAWHTRICAVGIVFSSWQQQSNQPVICVSALTLVLICRCCSQCRLVQHVNDVAAADRKRMNVNPLGVFLRCVARIYHCIYREFTSTHPGYTTVSDSTCFVWKCISECWFCWHFRIFIICIRVISMMGWTRNTRG
jgi:hypothetical protein